MIMSLLRPTMTKKDSSTQTTLSFGDLPPVINISEQIKFKSEFHRLYFNKIKEELGSLPSESEIDKNRWYYYKYMEPFYSDKIIHIYSTGNIGSGYNKMCVFCKQKGHIQRYCPVAKEQGLGYTHNF